MRVPFISLLVGFALCSAFNAPKIEIPTGLEMPDLTMRDTSGKMVSLRSLKGKFVYLDFWASWCRPCMHEVEPTRELQKQLEGNDKITWVFVSFDRDTAAWKEAVRNGGLKGIHLYADKKDIAKLKDDLDIYSIPFSIWVNTKGQITKYDAPRPSEGIYEKLEKTIERDEN